MNASVFYLSVLFIVAIYLSNSNVVGREVKVFKRGKIELIDETQFELPANADRLDFKSDPDLEKQSDINDAYDELVPYLPRYVVFKNGKDIGYSRLNISTRKQPTWSTPHPRTRKGQYRTWGTPKLEPITRPPRKQIADLSEVEKRKAGKRLEEKLRSQIETPTTVEKKKVTGPTVDDDQEQKQYTVTRKANRKLITSTTVATAEKQTNQEAITATKRSSKKVTTKSPTVAKVDNFQETVQTTLTRSFSKNTKTAVITTTEQSSSKTVQSTKQTTPTSVITERPKFKVKSRKEDEVRNEKKEDETSTSNGLRTQNEKQKTNANNSQKPPRLIVGIETSESDREINRHFSLGDREQKVKSNRFMIQSGIDKSNGSDESGDIFGDRQRPLIPMRRATTIVTRSFTSSHLTTINRRNDLKLTTTAQTQGDSATETSTRPNINKVAMKPPVIQEAGQQYKGPTFNCRVLDSAQDGKPSLYNDPECRLSSPGFSLDGTCKCTYEVSGRNEDGCATGFHFTCLPAVPIAQRRQ